MKQLILERYKIAELSDEALIHKWENDGFSDFWKDSLINDGGQKLLWSTQAEERAYLVILGEMERRNLL